MATPITVPRLGWNMEQGVFVGWLKADGAQVHAGDTLFTLESEKATEDIECFDDGVLHIPADGPSAGDTVTVGVVIGFVLAPGEPIPVASARTPVVPQQTRPQPLSLDAPTLKQTRPASSPRARRAAAKLGIDWRNAKGTGRNGRIRERDILSQATPVSTTRRIIAERMLTSARSTAPVTLMTTIDATRFFELREQWQGDVVPSYTDLFVQAAARALQAHPLLNARWQDERIVLQEEIHIGIAVDTEAGLLVPVIRDAARLDLAELAKQSRELIERARLRKLSAAEMEGGTFTISNLGAFGIDAFTPIINYPECAILGIGRIRRCPVVIGDAIVIRPQVTLSLTFDHRIADGAPAARFLQTLSAAIDQATGFGA